MTALWLTTRTTATSQWRLIHPHRSDCAPSPPRAQRAAARPERQRARVRLASLKRYTRPVRVQPFPRQAQLMPYPAALAERRRYARRVRRLPAFQQPPGRLPTLSADSPAQQRSAEKVQRRLPALNTDRGRPQAVQSGLTRMPVSTTLWRQRARHPDERRPPGLRWLMAQQQTARSRGYLRWLSRFARYPPPTSARAATPTRKRTQARLQRQTALWSPLPFQ